MYLTAQRRFEAHEHDLLVHADKHECPDGCDEQPAWCHCHRRPFIWRHFTGWRVCGRCQRAIDTRIA